MRIPIKKERIFRRLCLDKGLTITSLARSASLPKSYVSKTVEELRAKQAVFGTGKLTIDRKKLLREWGELKRSILASSRPLVADILIPDRVKEALGPYVVSGPFAEMLVQGQTPGKPMIVYSDENGMEDTLDKLSMFATIGKGSVFIYGYDMDIEYGSSMVKGWRIAALPQIAADLIALSTYADIGFELFNRWYDASGGIRKP
jgi:hypothetical protein